MNLDNLERRVALAEQGQLGEEELNQLLGRGRIKKD